MSVAARHIAGDLRHRRQFDMAVSEPRSMRIPERMIEAVNKLVRTSRQMLTEIGREPTPEELAEKLAMPLEKVRKLLDIAKQPITLAAPIGSAGDPDLG